MRGQAQEGLRKAKRLMLRLLFPPLPAALAVTALGFALLAWAFMSGGELGGLEYAAYALSFYVLVIWVALLARANPVAGAAQAAQRNRLLARVVNDRHHRLGLSTAASFGIDVLWTASNALSAVALGSAWFATLAAYYAALAIMRAPLSFNILRADAGQALRREHRLCQTCGVLLLLCTPVFAGFVVLALDRLSSFSYSEYLIYAVALYAFYSLIGGVVRFTRERRSPHPAVRVTNALYLVVAAVSMFSLEVAMIDMFGGSGDEWFRLIMIAATGAAVCIFAVAMGAWMVRSSSRALRELEREQA